MTQFIIYSKESCVFCTKAKDYITDKSYDFIEKRIDLDTDDSRADKKFILDFLVENNSPKTVPQIFHLTEGTLNYIGDCETFINTY